MATVRTSQNGWPVHPTSAGCVSLSWITGRVDPRVHDLLDRFCKRFDAEVEPIIRAHSWGYANRAIRGSTQVSNHASGTAIDLNAPAHPMGKRGTFTQKQERAIRAILRDFPQLTWGEDWKRPDEMHFEINVKPEALMAVPRMASPAEGRFSSGYGPRNLAIAPYHAGVDIANSVGTPIYAAFAGKVEDAGWGIVKYRSGNGVLIKNKDGERQYYGHLSRIRVKVGQSVSRGERIGDMGATGNVTGPHLHFETWANSSERSHYDPAKLFRKYGISIGSPLSNPDKTPPSSGGSPAPKPKEWDEMASKDDLKAAIREVLTDDWISVGGATGKRYGDGQAAPYSLMRDGGYSLDELRDLPTRKFPVHGSLKGESGADDMTLLNMWRRAAGSQADLRRYYPRIMAELGALQANLAGDVTAAEVARELAPLLLDDLSASITDAIEARQGGTPEEIAQAVITEITARLED